MKVHQASPQEKERIAELLAAALAAEPDVVFAYLHGSFVEADAFRDIDVAVFFDPLPERPWRAKGSWPTGWKQACERPDSPSP